MFNTRIRNLNNRTVDNEEKKPGWQLIHRRMCFNVAGTFEWQDAACMMTDNFTNHKPISKVGTRGSKTNPQKQDSQIQYPASGCSLDS